MDGDSNVQEEQTLNAPDVVDESRPSVDKSDSVFGDSTKTLNYRGELTIDQGEVERINNLILHANFRFVIYVNETAKQPPKKTRLDPSLSLNDSIGSSFESRTRKSLSTLQSLDSRDDDALTVSSYDLSEKRSLRKRKQRVRYYEEFAEDPVDGNYREVKQEKSQKTQKESLKKAGSIGGYDQRQVQQLYRAVPVLSRNLPKLPRNTWEYTAYRLLQQLKYLDSDKWFWYPVDPVADGVPTYSKVIKTPMDFYTIIERLHLRQYPNPFAFQCDVRQIFFNAFLFYPPDNRIWQAAEHLARAYEEKLGQTRYLHPDEFRELLSTGEDAMRSTLLDYNEATFNRKSKMASTSFSSMDDIDLSRPLEKRRAAQNNRHKHILDQFMYNDDDDDSFNELSSVASADEYMMPVDSIRANQRGNKRRGGNTKSSHGAKKSGVDGYDLSDSESRMRYVGNFIAPETGYVPPPPAPIPPGLQKAGGFERGLTPAQTRTLDINLSRLAPNQRKAALELIEDDLGILAEVFMNDTSFTFDPNLLSVDKQRRVFVYINQMAKRNLEDMQAALERNRRIKPVKPGTSERDNKATTQSNPSEMFDASSSSSSEISDVASNFLSSDDFFESSDEEHSGAHNGTAKSGVKDTSLPEYTPVDELKPEKVQLTRGIMGDHADFLDHVESPPANDDGTPGQQGKKTAWMEWKGQAIHHGTVAQQNGVKPRSVDEQIAESFDARI